MISVGLALILFTTIQLIMREHPCVSYKIPKWKVVMPQIILVVFIIPGINLNYLCFVWAEEENIFG